MCYNYKHISRIWKIWHRFNKTQSFQLKNQVASNFNCVLGLVNTYTLIGKVKWHSQTHLTGNITVGVPVTGFFIVVLLKLYCPQHMNKSFPK